MLAILVVAWLTAFTLTHIPMPQMPEGVEVSDKTLHIVGFAGLTTLFVLTMLAYGVRRPRRLLCAVIVLPLYAALDERTQPWCNRTCDFRDWASDMLGMLVMLGVVETALFLLERLRRAKAETTDRPLSGE